MFQEEMNSVQKHTSFFDRLEQALGYILQNLNGPINLATPLGLGKPNQLLNLIYQYAVNHPELQLKIFTALSLQPPQPQGELAQRFFEPFAAKQWGADYPRLQYFQDAARGKCPGNIQVHEFYFQAGTALKSPTLQRHYQSVNYTHVAENLFRSEVNVIVQLIAAKKDSGRVRYSLSCNPDLTLDVVDLYGQRQKKVIVIGVIHPDLPFLTGESEVVADFFDAIVDSPEVQHQLFALPRMPMSLEDHLIGFYSSMLVEDGGTIQIGIGSLSDAIVSALQVRQNKNKNYLLMASHLPSHVQNLNVLNEGLYGLTEMLTDGFMHLRQMGVLKRVVQDEVSGQKTYLHGSFFLGSKLFYKWVWQLSPEDMAGLRMSRVSRVNDLYDPQEVLLRQQRVKARFFNTTMQVSLLGEAASETLNDAHVVSGVGGQYNFVAMSHELKGSRSVLMLRSARQEKGHRKSNIVMQLGHPTIPRHLRDMIVTEYGIADLKGRTDEECIQAMLQIADSEFQDELMKEAKKSGKLAPNYQIPNEFRHNTPQKLKQLLELKEFESHFIPFPFGSDFTEEEEVILLALQRIQDDLKVSIWKLIKNFLFCAQHMKDFSQELERMKLRKPKNIQEFFYRRLLRSYLRARGKTKA